MILELKAKHFKDTEFGDAENCAIVKAYKEANPNETGFVLEGVTDIFIFEAIEDEKPVAILIHEPYHSYNFNNDAILAKTHNYDDTVVRKLKLTNKNDLFGNKQSKFNKQ